MGGFAYANSLILFRRVAPNTFELRVYPWDTCYATVGGAMGAIGSFPSNVEITMVDNNSAIKAQPTVLSKDGTSFSEAWVSSGP